MLIDVSIIICTRNRVEELRRTLSAMSGVDVPPEWGVELIVVDNASTDDTRQVVESFQWAGVCVRYVLEQREGKSHALNAGVGAAEGRALLFADDDVRPCGKWLERMCGPILGGELDVVAGGIVLSSALEREWMHDLHKAWLGTNLDRKWTPPVVAFLAGANMAVSREAMGFVGGFDPELGPGPDGLGNAEETLLVAQLRRAGARVGQAPHAMVEHHTQPSNASREALLRAAWNRGRSDAYIAYHWEHMDARRPWHPWLASLLSLWWCRLRAALRHDAVSAPSEAEMHLLSQVAFWKQYQIERSRPRNYEKHGLRKVAGLLPHATPRLHHHLHLQPPR